MRNYWNYIKIKSAALECNSRAEFQHKNKAAYLAAYRRGVLDEVCSHMEFKRTTWSLEKALVVALTCKTRTEFQDKYGGAYMFCLKNNFLDEVCSHMPKHVDQSGENNPVFKWNDNLLQNEALKFSSYVEFYTKNSGAYQAACKRGLTFLDNICSHMSLPNNRAYSKEELYYTIKSCKTRSELIEKFPSVYVIALKRDDYEDMCSHMRASRGSSKEERALLSIIKNSYGNAKSIKDRKVKILNKPYIKGFEIDIFVPELNKGIEFDGTYYHNFEHMREQKNKKLWPDEDIRNYHKIKDSWFATKGIQILHIKEEDWILDKEVCIKRCLDFLKGGLCQ